MRYLLCLILLAGLIITTPGQSRDILQFNYFVAAKEGESLDEILTRFVSKGYHIVSNDKMMIKIVDSNPQITNWHKIPHRERVALFIFRERANMKRIKQYIIARRELLELERQDMSISP